jgi:hypothetical protein
VENLTKRIEAAQEIFGFSKEVESVLVTSDGTCFTNKNLAQNHNHTFEDKSIVSIDRELNATLVVDVEGKTLEEPKPVFEVDETEDAGAAATGKVEPASTSVKPFVKMRKDELQSYCQEKGIEYAEDATNAQLVALIEDAETPKA